MANRAAAKRTLDLGQQYPYDDRAPTDAAHLAALGVLTDLCGRGGIRQALDDIDADIKTELVDSLAAIIRCATMPSM